MEAVQPLVKPCLWTAAEAAAGLRPVPPYASAAVDVPLSGGVTAASLGPLAVGPGQHHQAAASEAGPVADKDARAKAVSPAAPAGGGAGFASPIKGLGAEIVTDGPATKPFALAEESSDSEGPLPDIDSGSSSSDSEDD
eukprot:gene13211-13342_t